MMIEPQGIKTWSTASVIWFCCLTKLKSSLLNLRGGFHFQELQAMEDEEREEGGH